MELDRRKALLKRLINNILKGKVNSESVPSKYLENEIDSSRPTYYSPQDRSGYNYGYTETKETENENNQRDS